MSLMQVVVKEPAHAPCLITHIHKSVQRIIINIQNICHQLKSFCLLKSIKTNVNKISALGAGSALSPPRRFDWLICQQEYTKTTDLRPDVLCAKEEPTQC